ncbi:hypothetical protein PGT21_033769 [Puccinia graminis f. sp. tritici]|uniref:Uncharacterized protein n=1 Tax=Puccinia graminis f. sp. tritici TaxID=56615 RepID=A0A5B0QY33_PUCGR|nr:hypothetical protein PGT21_033769 [Puccinia graminis f. sp. tritici]
MLISIPVNTADILDQFPASTFFQHRRSDFPCLDRTYRIVSFAFHQPNRLSRTPSHKLTTESELLLSSSSNSDWFSTSSRIELGDRPGLSAHGKASCLTSAAVNSSGCGGCDSGPSLSAVIAAPVQILLTRPIIRCRFRFRSIPTTADIDSPDTSSTSPPD